MRVHHVFFLLLLAFSCHKSPGDRLFTRLDHTDTGIDFRNLIQEKETFNIFKYQYFYNGGGVAAGDFNNDGLVDLVFTGNMVKNRLYLNKGNFEFEDVTQKAGIAEKEGWCTGVCPVDINRDGRLDLYICRAGYPFDHLRHNLLYINNGDGTFAERSAEYGLADLAHATQASFFDYDKDGDLDLFLLNHSTVEYSRGSLEVIPLRQKKTPAFTNKLLKNENGVFQDVTEAAGIYSNVLTFSLGIGISDVNLDGWPDIFIANDFNEPDYLFINNGDGTFTDQIKERLDHTSLFSMGCDFADFNNDAAVDFASLDMLPESNHLQKMHAGVDNFDKLALLTNAGLLRQFSRNMLQRNNGDGTFSEIGQMAGVANTDWSWAPLFFDFDNDGWKDLFIANGYLRDHTDMDFLKFTADEVVKIQRGEQHVGFQDYLKKMPPIEQPNYFFQNRGDGFYFANRTADWGDPEPSVSQGALYADLDNDGDLDLVVNNSEAYAGVYRNNAVELHPENHFLKIQLTGAPANPAGIGAKVYAFTGERTFYLEQNPVRGFQSSVDPTLHLGLGAVANLDSLWVVWPTDEKNVLRQVAANQTLTVRQDQAGGRHRYAPSASAPVFAAAPAPPFTHRENNYNDFKTQLLLPWFYSRPGPALAAGDADGDGLDDVFAGGAQGQAGQVFFQTPGGAWRPGPAFSADAGCEDAAACWFDADGDGRLDLYVASGGYEFDPADPATRDRLYRNRGGGRLERDPAALPADLGLSSCVRAGDADGDGDLDLFVGSSVKPGRFPEKSGADALLLNNGQGAFTRLDLPVQGLTSDALWVDLRGDKRPELVVSAEWGAIQVFELQDGKVAALSADTPLGLWHCLAAGDLDGDGDTDLVAGNLGLNSQLSASESLPLELYAGDFDRNGSVDPILVYAVQGALFPFPAMEDLNAQVPPFRKKFVYFKDYADARIEDVLDAERMKLAQRLHATTLASVWLKNEGGRLQAVPLPDAAQVAPLYALSLADVNGDGAPDCVAGGNTTYAKVKLGSLDGNHGLVLLGDGRGGFRAMPYAQSGLHLRGDVRSLELINIAGKKGLLAGENDRPLRLFSFQ